MGMESIKEKIEVERNYQMVLDFWIAASVLVGASAEETGVSASVRVSAAEAEGEAEVSASARASAEAEGEAERETEASVSAEASAVIVKEENIIQKLVI